MDLRLFPLDTQNCDLIIESCKYTLYFFRWGHYCKNRQSPFLSQGCQLNSTLKTLCLILYSGKHWGVFQCSFQSWNISNSFANFDWTVMDQRISEKILSESLEQLQRHFSRWKRDVRNVSSIFIYVSSASRSLWGSLEERGCCWEKNCYW